MFLSKIVYRLYTLRKSSSFVNIHTVIRHYSGGDRGFDQWFTKIISGLSVSTLHQLRINTKFVFELSRSRLFNHALLCIIERLFVFQSHLNAQILIADILKVLSSEPLSSNIITLKGGQSAIL